MTGSEARDTTPGKDDLVAPVWHLAVLLAVFAALAVLGWLAQRSARPRVSGAAPPAGLVTLQIQAIVFEWATFAWVCFGIRRKGLRVRELIGGRWTDTESFAGRIAFRGDSLSKDLLLAGTLWLLWMGITRVANLLLGQSADRIPYPESLLEAMLAVVVAISAGVCEEVVFRGYLQRQFRALTGSASIAILLQAAVFGVPHVYQGMRIAATAALYGILFGVVAHWRRSLRPGILAHAWSDIAARIFRI